MQLGLKDKRVLITGASRGIGAAIAESFLKEEANSYLVSRGSPALIKTESNLKNAYPHRKIIADSCDCTDAKSLLSLKKRVMDNWSGLDVVIANVGDGRSVDDAIPNAEQWKQTWDKNFESALLTARTFLPLLEESNGCLLFISSITAKEALGAPVDYSTAKSAVNALAMNMARKLAQKVRVNVIAPGNVHFSDGTWDQKLKENPEAVTKMLKDTVPMNRFGTTEEIADAAVFLCSSRASYITGSILVVDGGQTVGIN